MMTTPRCQVPRGSDGGTWQQDDAGQPVWVMSALVITPPLTV